MEWLTCSELPTVRFAEISILSIFGRKYGPISRHFWPNKNCPNVETPKAISVALH